MDFLGAALGISTCITTLRWWAKRNMVEKKQVYFSFKP